jgi:ubiquinone/menaquinone biosynthesis C-methylase UbiE
LKQLLRLFLAANKRAAHAIEPHLPQRRLDLEREYEETVARYMATLPPGAIVVDVGAGRRSRFARLRPVGSEVKIVGLDSSARELAANADVDETVVVDATERLPFSTAAVDMVVSSSMLEHLPDTEAFVRESCRILRTGGVCVHLFSSKFAPFALINQTLPTKASTYLLRMLHPESEGSVGFRAYYDRTYASEIRALLAAYGCRVEASTASFYQSGYYNFFLPLYLASALYELVVRALKADDLAAKVMVVARKGGTAS